MYSSWRLRAHRVHLHRRLHVREIVAAQIADGELAEDVVENRRRHLDVIVTDDRTVGLEAREGERLDELFERHAVLQAERDCDREVVHQRAEGRAFLVHVDEDLAELAAFVFAGAQVDFVTAAIVAFCV